MVKMGLEVSSLGENLGTANEPAFRIGTRNAETFMLLRDGETAILGGLIQDAERNNRVKVPGVGDIPVIGSLFTAYDDQTQRTDVLLTITPRVVRGWDLPTRAAREFYSGSENVYTDKPLFAALQTAAGAQIRMEPAAPPVAVPTPSAPAVVTGPLTQPGVPSPAAAAAAVAPQLLATAPAAAPAAAAVPGGGAPLLTFSEPVYEVSAGQDFEIRVLAANLPGGATLPLEILYNPQLLTYVSGNRGEVATDSFNASAEASRGLVSLSLALAAAAPAPSNAVLARLVMRGEKPGISYLVYRAPAIRTASGEVLNAQVRAARVLIK
jgi:general secretion pathway protein D